MPRAREHPALLAFFLPLTRRTCAELGVGDETVAAYLAGVLAEFARTERLYRLPAPPGERLVSVVEMLGVGPATPGPEGERAFHRYVGDFALFMSGLFRPFVERGGFLGHYLDAGARAYARVTALSDACPRGERLLYAELAARFRARKRGSDRSQRARGNAPCGDSREHRRSAREIEGVLAGLSRN